MDERAVGLDQRVVGLDACAVPAVDPERVGAARQRLLPAVEAQRLSDLFRLLGDATRVRILYALLEVGELCVCDLAATTGMAESATSHALRLLRAHRVVKVRRAGRVAYYSLIDGHVRMLLDVALEHMGHGDG